MRVLAVEALAGNLERRAVGSEAQVGKGEPGSIALYAMLPVATAEHEPPVGRETFGKMDGGNDQSLGVLAGHEVDEPAGVLIGDVDP